MKKQTFTAEQLRDMQTRLFRVFTSDEELEEFLENYAGNEKTIIASGIMFGMNFALEKLAQLVDAE